MARDGYILAIDQGTTSSRAILFDSEGRAAGSAQRELPQIFPQDGWVEHDPEEIWRATLEVCRKVIAESGHGAGEIAAIGITNQRETTILWERATGRPIYNAIVWQDRRTADLCRRLSDDGFGDLVAARTGLVIDPYFSATKIAWLLDNVEGARQAAAAAAGGPVSSALGREAGRTGAGSAVGEHAHAKITEPNWMRGRTIIEIKDGPPDAVGAHVYREAIRFLGHRPACVLAEIEYH